MQRLRFGFLATGNISRRLATTMKTSQTCQLVAAASRSAEKARAFAEEFGVEGVAGYEELLTRDDIEAVYIATPHPQHHEWCLRAIAHGKHVLCEKPFTMTLAELEEVVTAARERGVLLVEAFMYRFHPQTRRLVELVRSGAVGEVRWIQADFGFVAEYQPESRLFARELGGGGILDVGCYSVSMARMLAGAAVQMPFLDPVSLQAIGRLNDAEGTDWIAGALLDFPGEMMASVRCSTRFNLGKLVRVEGTLGTIEANEPWFAGSKVANLRVRVGDSETIYETADPSDLYSAMCDEFAACHRAGRTESAMMNHADSLGNMRALEEWYGKVGVRY